MKKLSCKKKYFIICWLCFMVGKTFGQEVPTGFVDMGVRADNGDILYWSTRDLMIGEDEIRYADLGQQGFPLNWKCMVQMLGADNKKMPTEFSGNRNFDIVQSKLGGSYRLPTLSEVMRLANNCKKETETNRIVLPDYDKRGVPTWLYGQWMWQNPSASSKQWSSIQFDDVVVSLVNQNGLGNFNGVYSYNKEKQIVSFGKFKLRIKVPHQELEADDGSTYVKVSNNARSRMATKFVLTSKINGATLLFAYPPQIASMENNKGMMLVYKEAQKAEYLVGNFYREGNRLGLLVLTFQNNKINLIADEYYSNKSFRIRPVWVESGSGTRMKMAEQKKDTLLAKAHREKSILEKEVNQYVRNAEKRSDAMLQLDIKEGKNSSLINVIGEYQRSAGKLKQASMSPYRGSDVIVISNVGVNVKWEQQQLAEYWEKINDYYSDLLKTYDKVLAEIDVLCADSSVIVKKIKDEQLRWEQEAQDSLASYDTMREQAEQIYKDHAEFYNQCLLKVKKAIGGKRELFLDGKAKVQKEYDELAAMSEEKAKRKTKYRKESNTRNRYNLRDKVRVMMINR